jgi:hypothetical protein
MSATIVNEVSDQIQKFWAPIFVPELKENAILPNLINTTYSSNLSAQGDTVYVSMVEAADGSRQTIDASGNHTAIQSEKLKTQRVGIVADQVFSASFELDSLIDLQSQLGSPSGQSSIRAALLKGIELQINKYIYSLVSPSLSAPDLSINGVTDFNFAQLQTVRKLASQAKWGKDKPWYLLLDPAYYNDFMTDTKNTSSDFVGGDLPLIGGQRPFVRSGFQVLEDNSDGMQGLGAATGIEDLALAFHPDFMYMVAQMQPTFKLSDLHANKQRGYLLTVDMVGGAKLGIQGALKHIVVYNS